MSTTTDKKRKIIDLEEPTFKVLSIMAASKGTNLKSYIEDVLTSVASDFEDTVLYNSLAKERPEGNMMLNKKEKANFLKNIGL